MCAARPYMHGARGASGDTSSSSRNNTDVNCKVNVLEVDLSFVPSSFWSKLQQTYSVEAAAHGLVCISNDSEYHHYLARVMRREQGVEEQEEEQEEAWGAGRPWSNRYCLLNPLTRTCIVLPEPPFKVGKWLLPTSTSVAILGWSDPETGPQAVLSATYEWQSASAAGGGWVSSCKLLLPGSEERTYCNWRGAGRPSLLVHSSRQQGACDGGDEWGAGGGWGTRVC